MDNCLFCKIIKGEIPCYKIYEDENVLAFLDISNDCNGHTLVIPKKHCENILDCDEKSLAEIMSAVKKIALHYVQDCGFDGVNIINANGESSGQTVFHLHIHLMPRKKDDGLDIFPKLAQNKESLEEICQKLRMTK